MEAYTRYIWVLWDVAAVAVLFYLVWQSAVRGLVRTLVSFCGYAAAAIAANMAAPILAKLAYDHLVRDALTLVIMRRLENFLSQGGALADSLLNAIPGNLQKVISPDLLSSTESEADLTGMVEGIIDAALRDPVMSLIQGLLFLILFTVALLLVRHFSRLFTGIYKIPVIGNINTLLGGVLGVLEAGLVLLIAALVSHLLITVTGGGFFWMNERIMDNTYVWRVFYLWTTFSV